MATKSSINYLGFDFDFDYNYSKGIPATWDEPAEYEEYEIYNITLNGIDATDLLEGQIYAFEEAVIENLKSY